ncbi:MAG: pyridoxamine 5'-phosphate oxidase family protein, partial [Gaiellales bacterium]
MPTKRTKVKRLPKLATYDRPEINAILDEAIVCHIGFESDGQPYATPSLHARVGDVLYLHGSQASRMMRNLASGAPCCVTVTLVDGVVLARRAFNQAINYRCVMVLGTAVAVEEPAEKLAALEALTNQLVPGRWEQTKPPSRQELKATMILRMPIDETSAKVRVGEPTSHDEDLPEWSRTWAGVLPITQQVGEPIPIKALPNDVEVPA